MALRKRPIEKSGERKNTFNKPKRTVRSTNLKNYDGDSLRTDKKSPSKSFDKKDTRSSSRNNDAKPFNRFKRTESSEDRFSQNKFSSEHKSTERTPFKKTNGFNRKEKDVKVYSSASGKKSSGNFKNKYDDKTEKSYPAKKFTKRDSDKPSGFKKDFVSKNRNNDRTEKSYPAKKFTKRDLDKPSEFKKDFTKKPFNRKSSEDKNKTEFKSNLILTEKKFGREKKIKKDVEPEKHTDLVRLNRYVSNAGICSRREADKLISTGLVSVNGTVVTEMGYQVKNSDDVRFNGQRLSREKRVYIIMNKPKDSIATLDDPDGRNTIMDVLGSEIRERVYPVGRLDRNTTGVIILTNDGEIAQRLMHPKYEVEKVYKATLNKTFKGEDFWQLTNGVELEDGFIKPDELAYPDPKNKTEVGVLIHSGRNRIIHRMFEHLGYTLDKLDRVSYGGFVKTGLKRGEWRHLTDKEITTLKRMAKVG